MSPLLKSAITSHVLDNLSPFRDASGISIFFRDSNRQEKFYRHAKRARELLMQNDSSLTLSRFQIRQISLPNTNADSQLCLSHLAPFAQCADWILAGRKPIDRRLWQQDFMPGLYCGARLTDQPRSANVFVCRQCGKTFVFLLWENREFLASSGLDELNLAHLFLSFIDFATMADGNNDEPVTLDIEDDAPVAHAQPRAKSALESFHIALSGLRKRDELCLEPSSYIGGETKPLTRCSGGPDDLHESSIAYSDITVKINIAYCDIGFVE
jgi:hypothetical protein